MLSCMSCASGSSIWTACVLDLADGLISRLRHECMISPTRMADTLSTGPSLACDAGTAVQATRIHDRARMYSNVLYTNTTTPRSPMRSPVYRDSQQVPTYIEDRAALAAYRKGVEIVVTHASTSYLWPMAAACVVDTCAAGAWAADTSPGSSSSSPCSLIGCR